MRTRTTRTGDPISESSTSLVGVPSTAIMFQRQVFRIAAVYCDDDLVRAIGPETSLASFARLVRSSSGAIDVFSAARSGSSQEEAHLFVHPQGQFRARVRLQTPRPKG